MRAVLDSNVLVAALRSRQGAANAILRETARKRFEIALSVPLYCEYLDVLSRPGMVPLTQEYVEEFCLSLAAIAHLQEIYFLWRPLLPDPKDDMVLELAVAAQARYLVTFNTGDFRPAGSFRLKVVTPSHFLTLL